MDLMGDFFRWIQRGIYIVSALHYISMEKAGEGRENSEEAAVAMFDG